MSRRPDAKTVKITESSLTALKEVKEIIHETSYSQSILKMWTEIAKVYSNSPIDEDNLKNDNTKDKTIVLSREAHVILNNIKYDKNLKTISDAVEWLAVEWRKNRRTGIYVKG